MAADLGGSQISALLESVPGIRNVLRSPVADALVNIIRSAASLRPFALEDVDELIQYAVRRGLINQSEGDQVLEEVRGSGAARRAAGKKPSAKKRPAPRAVKQPAKKKPTVGKSSRPKGPARRPAKKR
jgi:hypothetical protein